MHLGQDITICGFLPQQGARLLGTAILPEQGSKTPRKQTERSMWTDAPLPLCPCSGSTLSKKERALSFLQTVTYKLS